MEDSSVANNKSFYKGKRVFVTGHTGFKGAWLTAMLHCLGSVSCGYALEAPKDGLYAKISGDDLIQSTLGNLLDKELLERCILNFKPEIIIHLAAFGFVNECFLDPVRAYHTNVIGTLNLLEAARKCGSVKSVVLVSTDKVYENNGDGACYKETDPVGGLGPYSASKSCMEILARDYNSTYFSDESRRIGLATVRASNVLGGGDHIQTRLIPSVLKAVFEHKPVELRNPEQTRPWQSVLDALNGYLAVARFLYNKPEEYSCAWNIGPTSDGIKTVGWVVDTIQNFFEGVTSQKSSHEFRIKESATLGLDIKKAVTELDWQPLLPVQKTIELVAEFYKRQVNGENERSICLEQIKEFLGE